MLPWWLAAVLFPINRVPQMCHTSCMLLEPLIIVVDASASSATLVFMYFRGDIPYTTKPSKIADTLYLV